MSQAQVEAFEPFWSDLIARCEKTYPETVEALQLERMAALPLLSGPLVHQRKNWVHSMNACLTLMQLSDLEDNLWAKAVIFRWIWDWELAHPEELVLHTSEPSGDDRRPNRD